MLIDLTRFAQANTPHLANAACSVLMVRDGQMCVQISTPDKEVLARVLDWAPGAYLAEEVLVAFDVRMHTGTSAPQDAIFYMHASRDGDFETVAYPYVEFDGGMMVMDPIEMDALGMQGGLVDTLRMSFTKDLEDIDSVLTDIDASATPKPQLYATLDMAATAALTHHERGPIEVILVADNADRARALAALGLNEKEGRTP